MPDIQWIKISTGIFDDEKINLIEELPDHDTILVIWFKLLVLAGKRNDGGLVYITRDIPYDPEKLARVMRRPLNTVKLALETFKQFGMIAIENEYILIDKWDKHQNVEGLDKIREQNRIRQQKYREKQKQITDDNVKSRDNNGTDKTREDKTREDSSEPVSLPSSLTTKKDCDTWKHHISKPGVDELPPGFAEVWEAYPKKTDKKGAVKKYLETRKVCGFDDLMRAVRNYAAEVRDREKQYIKHAKTFFGPDEPWRDYLENDLTDRSNYVTMVKTIDMEVNG